MVRDARLDRGQHSYFVGDDFQVAVSLRAGLGEQGPVVDEVRIRGWVQYSATHQDSVNGVYYNLEIELGDGGPWRVRVPNRFVDSDENRIAEESSRQYPLVPRPSDPRRGPSGPVWISANGSTIVSTHLDADDEKQTYVLLDTADRAVLLPAFHEALAQAHRIAAAVGLQPSPVVEDPAAIIERLPRSTRKPPRPPQDLSGGFSAT